MERSRLMFQPTMAEVVIEFTYTFSILLHLSFTSSSNLFTPLYLSNSIFNSIVYVDMIICNYSVERNVFCKKQCWNYAKRIAAFWKFLCYGEILSTVKLIVHFDHCKIQNFVVHFHLCCCVHTMLELNRLLNVRGNELMEEKRGN